MGAGGEADNRKRRMGKGTAGKGAGPHHFHDAAIADQDKSMVRLETVMIGAAWFLSSAVLSTLNECFPGVSSGFLSSASSGASSCSVREGVAVDEPAVAEANGLSSSCPQPVATCVLTRLWAAARA